MVYNFALLRKTRTIFACPFSLVLSHKLKEVIHMPKYPILLCCGAGMSSGFLANSAQKAANKKNTGMTIVAKSQSVVEDIIEDYVLLLLGPHYKSHLNEFEEMAAPFGIPVAVIPQEIYGSLDGDGLVEFALKQLEK